MTSFETEAKSNSEIAFIVKLLKNFVVCVHQTVGIVRGLQLNNLFTYHMPISYDFVS